MSLVVSLSLTGVSHVLQTLFLSIMPVLWIAHESKTKKDPTLIHSRLANALTVHLIKKKNVPLEMQGTISNYSGREPIYVVAKDDVELAKILMFLDIVTSVAKKKFGSRARVEDVVPAEMRVFTAGKDVRLELKKYREKILKERNKKPLTFEDVITSEKILGIIATKIASSAKQKASIEEVKQMIKEYIPYIKKIANAYPDDPAFYDKIMRIPGLPDVERDIKQLNPKLYRAIEDLAEKLKEDLREPEKPELQKSEKTQQSIDLNAKLEVLSILKGLEFVSFSEEAKQKAIEKLSRRIEELLEGEVTGESVCKLGLYALVIEIIKRDEFDRIKEIEKV